MNTDTPALQRFLHGDANRETAAALVRQALLDGDPSSPPAEPEHHAPEAYAAVLDRAAAGAAGLTAAGSPWDDVKTLRDDSFAALFEDPRRAVALARRAVTAAEAIEDGPETAPLRADLRALAHGQLGNALRVSSDLRGAEAALDRAFDEADAGTGDLLVRARLLSLAASLRSDQSRFAEAVDLAGRAARLYRRLDDDHGRGRTLLKQATFHAYRGDLEAACVRLANALEGIDAKAEPRLALTAHHNLASYLDRLGRSDEALAELTAAEELCTAPLDRLRQRWLRGRIDLHRGDGAAAEAALWEVRSGFLELGIGYDAALVSLELAALFAEQGRNAELHRLADEMVPVFAARDVHREAEAALRLCCEAARAETVEVELVQRVAAYLEKARNRPNLSFSDA